MAHASPATAHWLDAESNDLVNGFWQAAGALEPFPRTLEHPLLLALPISIVKLARLHVKSANDWLRARGMAHTFAAEPEAGAASSAGFGADRAIHGCIVALGGHAFLFVDGGDAADEMRFTIAHELGHFLADQLLPRRKAVARMGESILEVLDGKRPPTLIEKLSSAMAGLQIGGYRSFLPRSESADGGLELWRVESRADRIGAALLAPPELVLSAARGATFAERNQNAVAALTTLYGLPAAPAAHYAQALLDANKRVATWAERFPR